MMAQIRNIFTILLIAALLLGMGLPFGEEPALANEGEEEQLDLTEIELPDKGNHKLDSQLNRLVSKADARRSLITVPESSENVTEESVRVILEVLPGQVDAASRAAGNLGVIEASYGNLLQVTVPVSRLAALADDPNIRLVRMPQTPIPATVTSEGAARINADDWNSAGYNGTGVKVGILDVGFSGYASLLGTELPSTVSTNWSVSLKGPGTNIHGTACAEIIYDIAPGAQFYLANFDNEVEMGNAVNWMISQGVDVISCSIGWPVGGPGDGTGPICDIVNTARAAGILWSQSMGNQAQRHWQGDFVDTEPDGFHEFDPGTDISNAIYVSNNTTIVVSLKWNDTWGSSGNDYDLLLVDKDLKLAAASVNPQDGDDDPWEELVHTANYTGYYHIIIATAESPALVNFHLYSAYHDLQYQTASSSFLIPADSSNVMSVGAVFWNTPSTVETFSSRGPTDGGLIKPDLVAPDGVSTASYGSSNGSGWASGGTGFFGTSASAPHAAAAAVLIKHCYSSYTAAQIQSFLESRAVEIGGDGKDNLYGSGLIDMGAFTLTIAVLGNGTTTPPVGTYRYVDGSVISITAFPAPGWEFSNWMGDVADNTSAHTTITMNSDKTVMARFTKVANILTIAINGNGSVSPVVGSHVYPFGATVNISAVPDTGWQFVNWTYPTSQSPEILRPDGPGLLTNIPYTYSSTVGDIMRNYLMVDEDVPDDGDTLVGTDNYVMGWARDLYSIQNHTGGHGNVDSVTVYIRSRHENNYPKALLMTYGTIYEQSLGSSTTWATHSYTWTVNPFTGNAWTWDEIDDLQIGVALMDTSPSLSIEQCTQVYAEITYTSSIVTDPNSSNTTVILDADATITANFIGLVSSLIYPSNITIALGRTQQFTATVTYSDNSTANITDSVTWTSSNTTVATINNAGLAQSLAEGQTVITATSGNVSANTTLTVSSKVVDVVVVTPTNPSIPAGRTQQFTATGTYSDNSTANITGSVTWSSSNTTIARINAAGLVRSYAEGTTIITATSGNATDNTMLTVGPAVLDAVIVTPVNPTISFVSGSPPTLQFVATASYSNGATAIVTNSANWTSDNTSVATIGPGTGLATTVTSGNTTISATYSGKTGNTTLTVLPDTLAPVITLNSPTEGQVLSDNTTTLSGTVDDLTATANVTVNGGAPIALTLGVSGNFSQSISLNTGSNTIVVAAVDGSGNTGTSGTITVTVNPNKPGITITQPPAGTVTANSSLTVTGTVSGNVTSANLILNGVSQTVTVAGGNFSANVTLTQGTNVIVVNAYTGGHDGDSDYLGTSGIRTVTLDTTPPAVTIATPVSGSVVITPGCVVSGSVDDPAVSTANLTINGASQLIPVVSGNFSQSVTLISGNNTVSVTATDAVGNTSLADNVTVIYDNTKPEVTITSPANGLATNTASQVVTGTISDPTITTATLYINGVNQTIPVSWGSFSAGVTLATGTNTLKVEATNGTGNTGTSGNITVTLDTTAPIITIGLSDPTDSISITVTSNEALALAPTVSVNSTSVTMGQTGINKWCSTYGSTGSPIAAGRYLVTANGTDKAGNTTIRIATFCKQTVTIADNETATVQTDTTVLEINTTANVTDASISVTQHLENPSGNVGNPSGAGKATGAYVEIVASPALRDNLEQIYIRVDYDPYGLPANTDESSLKLYLWDVVSGTWQAVLGSGVDTTEHYIYGTVTHLSKYGGFGAIKMEEYEEEQQSTGGGGGGGGGGGRTRVKLGGITATTDLELDSYGRAQEACQLISQDKKVCLNIARKTKLLDSEGKPLKSLVVTEVTSPHSPPSQTSIVSCHDFGPDGATFDPAITMTLHYDPESSPGGATEDELYIACWDGSQWLALESAVDTGAKTVSANVSHFTQFAVLGKLPSPSPPPPPLPARFTISDLAVTPAEVEPPGQITISVLVKNTGGSRGSYMAILKINGIEEGREEVTLGAYQSEAVTFAIVKDEAGSYTVDIGGQTEQFTVLALPLKPPPPEPEVTQTTTAETSVEPTTNWGLIGGIMSGCVIIVGLLGYLFVWRRRGILRS